MASASASAAAAAADGPEPIVLEDAPAQRTVGGAYADMPSLSSGAGTLALGDAAFASAGPKDSSEQQTVIAVLKQAWISERAAPELLNYEEGLVGTVKHAVDNRQRQINEFRRNSEMQWLCNVLQMEVDRAVYLLSSYHRCRLKKIEKFAPYLLMSKQHEEKCSGPEKKFLMGFVNLLHQHVGDSFLNQLPAKLRSWIDDARGVDQETVVKPDLDHSFVVFQVKETIEEFHCGDGDTVRLAEGDIVVGNWKVYSELFREGLIQLL